MKRINKKTCIMSLIFIIIIIIIILILAMYFIKNKDTRSEYNDNFKININLNNKLSIMNVNFESRLNTLKNYNYNNYFTLGWLQVQGTNIDFPIFTSVVRVSEEKGDIKPDFSYGWRHINYNLGENRMVLAAHNIINVSSKPLKNMEILSDFESLMAFVYYDFAKENQYIMYTDEEGNENLYVIYSVGFANIKDEESESIKYEDKDKLTEYISSVKDNSIYDYSVDVTSDDDIISLITCTRFFGIDKDTLFRVDARKIRENENTYKYNVKINKNYEEVNKKLNEEDV